MFEASSTCKLSKFDTDLDNLSKNTTVNGTRCVCVWKKKGGGGKLSKILAGFQSAIAILILLMMQGKDVEPVAGF